MSLAPGEDADARSPARFRPGAVRDLLRWYWPYLTRLRGRLLVTVLGLVVVLACQATIPILVETILHHEVWESKTIALLVVLVLVLLGLSYATHLSAHVLANTSALALRERLYAHLVRTRLGRQAGLQRSALVLRVTADVDRVSEAFETTLVDGLPGLARLGISLVLLTLIEWRAGVAMAVASVAFLLLRRWIGGRLTAADRVRLLALTDVGGGVDEAISTQRAAVGLHLREWQARLYRGSAVRLEHATHRQGVLVSRLILAAHATAYIGLLAVVIAAIAFGGSDVAAVAAALLYIEGAARGLEALPPWIRDVQLATVSQRRLDEILDEPERLSTRPGTVDAPNGLVLSDVETDAASGVPLAHASATLPPGGLTGLVVSSGTDIDAVLALLAGDDNPAQGVVLLDGRDVRQEEVSARVFFVPAESFVMGGSATELLGAVRPGLGETETLALLASVGLDHVLGSAAALSEPLGPQGLRLTTDERQRLMLAIALAAQPEVLLVGPLLALADIDTALPIISLIRAHDPRLTVLSVIDQTLAESVDRVAYVADGAVVVGTHHSLLVEVASYGDLWHRRLQSADVDLRVIGIEPDDEDLILARLVTERYEAGDLIYRQGAPADRVMFIVSGHVEITTGSGAAERRVAVLGPGTHCGDLRLTVGEERAESAYALDSCVVRSLSREAISAGLTGLLDRTAGERHVIEALLRGGPATAEELRTRTSGLDDHEYVTALALLERDGAVTVSGDRYSAVLRRSRKSGASDLLDRLGDLE